MNNQNENNFFIPILSAISGLGAIIASISPLFLKETTIAKIFINNELINFASIIAVITVVTALWLTASINSYLIFNNQNQSKFNFNLLIYFLLSSVGFYLMKSLSDSGIVETGLASFIQLPIYLLAFLLLSMLIGFLLRDSFQGFKRSQLENNKIDRIKDLLLKSGFIKIEIKIRSIEQYIPVENEFDRFGARKVLIELDTKLYRFIISSDFNQLFYSEEITE